MHSVQDSWRSSGVSNLSWVVIRRQRVQRWCFRCITPSFGFAILRRHRHHEHFEFDLVENGNGEKNWIEGIIAEAGSGCTTRKSTKARKSVNRNRSLCNHRRAYYRLARKAPYLQQRLALPTYHPHVTTIKPHDSHKNISSFNTLVLFIPVLPHPHHSRLPRHPNQHLLPTSLPASEPLQVH